MLIDPQIERFLKMTEEVLKQQYRASVVLKDSRLASKEIYEPIINGIFPHAIDREFDQTI